MFDIKDAFRYWFVSEYGPDRGGPKGTPPKEGYTAKDMKDAFEAGYEKAVSRIVYPAKIR